MRLTIPTATPNDLGVALLRLEVLERERDRILWAHRAMAARCDMEIAELRRVVADMEHRQKAALAAQAVPA